MPDGAGSGEARVGGVPLGQLSTVERLIAAAVVEADHETFRRRQGPFLEFLEATGRRPHRTCHDHEDSQRWHRHHHSEGTVHPTGLAR